MTDRAEPKPPWVAYPGIPPDEFFWREAGEPWLNLVWRPFWNALDEAGRERYLTRWPPPDVWRADFLDDALDRLVAEIDREDGITGLPPPGKRPPGRSWLTRSLARLLGLGSSP